MKEHEGGSLELIFGPMFSGKTTELCRRINRYSIARKKCIILKYQLDTRYSKEYVATHDSNMTAATTCSLLEEVNEVIQSYDVIGIDEGQFYHDIVAYCEKWAKEGKIVIVAALDGTFQRKPFGNILELIPLSEKVTKLNAVCMNCFNDASFTRRISNETEVEVIGGSDKYVAVCRKCFYSQDLTNIN